MTAHRKAATKKVAILIGVTFFVGLILGTVIFPPQTDTKWKVIHDTETVTKTEKVEVPIVSPACEQLVAITNQMMQASKQYEETMSELIDILSDVRIVANTHEMQRSNELTEKLYRLQPKTLEAAEILGSNTSAYTEAAKGCSEGK